MTTTRSTLRRVAAEAARRSPNRDGAATRRELPTSADASVATATPQADERAQEPGPEAVGTRRSIVIERVSPEIDGGREAVKRVVGDQLLVTADIFADGHDVLDAVLLVTADDEGAWREIPMRLIENDRWSASAPLERVGRHRYTIEAWRDAWGSWREGLLKKVDAKVPVATELAEGRLLLSDAMARAELAGRRADLNRMREALLRSRRARSERTAAAALAQERLMETVRRHPDRSWSTRLDHELPLMVDRERAGFSAWYELFPRSQGRRAGKATTLKGAEWRLPDIAAMGFDVVYLPPIHPIGHVNRKGRNNTLRARRGAPGSPWAIGSSDGGHTEVAAELGGLAELEHFRRAVEAHGMELAFDLAMQAAPDHPWVSEHPEWFRHAPDGSIKYAENPPKKYQDIYPIDFYGPDAAAREALWRAWLGVVMTWVERGRPTFEVRAVLAATLSTSWGMYSGFELCESKRLGKREEYASSEKYEIRVRDWDAPGNIKPLIARLNRLRRTRPALQAYEHLRFENATGPRTLFYRKALPAGGLDPLTGDPLRWRDPVYVAVNVDPRTPERGILHPDLPAIGIGWQEPYRMTDLLTGRRRTERGADVAVDLTPEQPFRLC